MSRKDGMGLTAPLVESYAMAQAGPPATAGLEKGKAMHNLRQFLANIVLDDKGIEEAVAKAKLDFQVLATEVKSDVEAAVKDVSPEVLSAVEAALQKLLTGLE
jgi:hypothetical protein